MAEHDLIVIGMGVGGEEVARRAADAGMDVMAVERKLVGGECPYWGCIPSKVMVRAGNTLAEAARATGLAGRAEISPDWAPVARRVREVTADWDDRIAVERHEKRGATFVRGSARLIGPREIEVDGRRFTARRGIVIATGGEPALPPIPGLHSVQVWTNREAIEATETPSSILVLGGGAVGLELGQVFHRFGSRVTVVEQGDHLLPAEEPENATALEAALSREGIQVHTRTSASAVSADSGGISVALSDGSTLACERLLVATGRRIDLRSLGVEAIGLDPDARAINVDEHLRAADDVWAVGDVTGKGAFTHVAVYQGRVAAADVLGQEHPPADYSAVPRVTFTDPEVGSVGLSEADARQRGLPVAVGLGQTSSSARGWIHGPGAADGVTKLVADVERGVLVGASAMGPAAGEVLGLLLLAVRAGVPLATLRDLIYPYPTFVRGIEDALRDLGTGQG
jgi:pyruvate/2-oxoglutarate dehydrogenase complex dihydrolipoamide dehydrogenase (E3) component